MKVTHFNSPSERMAYLKGKYEEIVPQIAKEEPKKAEKSVEAEEKPKKKAKKTKKDDKVQAE